MFSLFENAHLGSDIKSRYKFISKYYLIALRNLKSWQMMKTKTTQIFEQ